MHLVEDQVFDADFVGGMIEDLTYACAAAGEQKVEVEKVLDAPALDKMANEIMGKFINRPIYDTVIVLTSCLVRVLDETMALNLVDPEDTSVGGH